jgi:hypothetical protein
VTCRARRNPAEAPGASLALDELEQSLAMPTVFCAISGSRGEEPDQAYLRNWFEAVARARSHVRRTSATDETQAPAGERSALAPLLLQSSRYSATAPFDARERTARHAVVRCGFVLVAVVSDATLRTPARDETQKRYAVRWTPSVA